MIRIFVTLLSGLLFYSTASAQQWQLDFLVFERDDGLPFDAQQLGRFRAIDWPELLAIDNDVDVPLDEALFETLRAAEVQGVQVMPLEDSSLNEAAQKLDNSPRYRVLKQHSLRFAQNTTTPPMRLHYGAALRLMPRQEREPSLDITEYWRSQPDLAPPVETETLYGWFRLSHEIHPILSMDMSLLRVVDGVFPIQISPEGVREYHRDEINQYRLKSERLLRDGKITYFDHPQLGVLARLSKVEAQLDQ